MASVLSDITSAVTTALSNLPSAETIKDAERQQLLGALAKLQEALEPPMAPLQRICFSHYTLVAIRIAQGMGIFNAFVEAQGAELTLKTLSSKTKGDVKFLKRIMRAICSNSLCTETAPGSETYKPLPLALAIGDGLAAGATIKHFHTNIQVSVKMLEYFEKNGYQNPEDAYDSPFQFAYGTSEHYFDWLQKNPAIQDSFNLVMTNSQKYRGLGWFEKYPVHDKLATTSDPERVALVDIGGNVGHDLIALKKRYPDFRGKIVLEDLPHVVDAAKELPEGITAVGHDMFKRQPVRGAKAYFMQTVLHDWPDKQALEILARTREAMAEDSILLVNEHTTPPGANVTAFAAAIDLHMMEMFSALERTEVEWVELLEKAGFTVVKVYKRAEDPFSNALYEAVLNKAAWSGCCGVRCI
ncbi:S-adenosyl-L-methionine-dependent methyltransferase [Aspergillus karnatakaensis]|uniref:S-adenosyl-L-methionine-dependent methyltransferase n=1 Tax=Aspergillus karnatakaensis TaxID=1810916 RepID=UPI003CCC98EE